MLARLVRALGEAQLMPIHSRMRDEASVRDLRRRDGGSTARPGTGAFSGAQALAGFSDAFGRPTEAEPQGFSYLYEDRYLVEAHRIAEIGPTLGGLLKPNPYAEGAESYYNHTIYFDSPAFRAHNEAHQGDRVTVRPRIRAYRSSPSAPARALYLELKRRYHRAVAKRRTPIALDLAGRLLSDSSPEIGAPTSISSTMAEFQHLARRFKLRPSVSVLYHRSAFFGSPVQDVRVNIDRLVQYSHSTSLDAPVENFCCAIPPDQVVVEVKYGEDPPGDLLKRLRRLGLHPQGFSKYACAVAHLPTDWKSRGGTTAPWAFEGGEHRHISRCRGR